MGMGGVHGGQRDQCYLRRGGGSWHGGHLDVGGANSSTSSASAALAPVTHGAPSGPENGHWKEGTSHTWRALR